MSSPVHARAVHTGLRRRVGVKAELRKIQVVFRNMVPNSAYFPDCWDSFFFPGKKMLETGSGDVTPKLRIMVCTSTSNQQQCACVLIHALLHCMHAPVARFAGHVLGLRPVACGCTGATHAHPCPPDALLDGMNPCALRCLALLLARVYDACVSACRTIFWCC